jgi:hypothetical protein
MRKPGWVIAGVVVALVGLLFTLQGARSDQRKCDERLGVLGDRRPGDHQCRAGGGRRRYSWPGALTMAAEERHF